MDKKVLISITGTTCAGKSTLLKAIQNASDDVFIIPQVTTRQARSDDDPELIKHTNVFHQEDMFLYNRESSYGIEKNDINRFLLSDKTYAVAINGSDEIEMIKSRALPALQYKNILLTFADNYEAEISALSKHLKTAFSPENYNKRMNFYSRHIKEKLLHPDFVEQNIDLHLTRAMSPSVWSLKTAKLLQINPHNLYKSLCKEIQIQPVMKKYVNPEVASMLSQIISSLQHNKKQI